MKFSWSAAIVILSLGISTLAVADGPDDLGRLIGGKNESSTTAPAMVKDDGILRLTPDRTHLVRLNEDAASVIVTNPAHATVMLDSPRLLVVMPRQPGATTFTVLNKKGDVILEQDVIISAAQNRYVRVRRMCANGDSSCQPNAYFYCPDGCYEVLPVTAQEGASDIPEIAGTMQSATAGGANAPLMPPASQQQSENPLVEEETDAGETPAAPAAIEPDTSEGDE